MAEQEDGRGLVTQRVRELVETLRAAPAIQRYRDAEERFRADAELGRMQTALRWSYEKVQKAERQGRHDARLFQEVRDAQARIQRHPLVIEFVSARGEAQELLRATNDAMTEVLGLDVGASGGRAGAC
jgi:cell fate (sporulation/competence/biofilm development) regulator YlbF (YheA/YmcA/DUF963 family)